MWISKLNLTNFRNYSSLNLELPPHLVVIEGGNAQGKTNLLEAIYMLATTKSHRATNERELINYFVPENELFVTRIFAEVHKARDTLKVEMALKPGGNGEASSRKRIRSNGIVKHAIDYVGQVNVVLFSAQDIDTIAGAPALRRRFFDLVNSQLDPHYLHSLQRYQRVLLQRNHLLRLLQERQTPSEQLEFWDRELVESGSYLIDQRHCLVVEINQLAEAIHWELSSQTEKLNLVYLPSIGKEGHQTKMEFREALQKSRGKEVLQGMTLVGPHRDEFRFRVNDVDMGIYGSRGQQRTIALSLKLAEAKHFQAKVGDHPILLLDDVLSELDQPRRQHLLEFILPFQQVIITTTDLNLFEPSFLAQATKFRVREGNIKEI